MAWRHESPRGMRSCSRSRASTAATVSVGPASSVSVPPWGVATRIRTSPSRGAALLRRATRLAAGVAAAPISAAVTPAEAR